MRIGVYLAHLDETPDASDEIFTEAERRYCLSRPHPKQHLAARFAAKQAAQRALDREPALPLSSIEVVRLPGRAPSLRLLGRREEKAWVSLSHSGDYAVALVVIE